MRTPKRANTGFTIVELLIVIVVIAILAAITIVAYNGIQVRSRDTTRAHDFATIEKALKGYDALYGGVPTTTTYSGNGNGGWNYSSMTNWLTFLEKDFGKMPRDSINTFGDSTVWPDQPGARLYFYFCYPSSYLVESPPKPTVRFGYHTEKSDALVVKNFVVQSCLTALP